MTCMSEPSGFPPYEPDRLPSEQPPRPASAGHRVGRAEGVSTRVEGRGSQYASVTVLGFRLVDPQTGRPAEVELRGRSISGTVREGDWVEVAGEPARSGRLEPSRVTNLTTGSEVGAAGDTRGPLAKTLAVLIVLFFLVVLGFIVHGAYGVITGSGF